MTCAGNLVREAQSEDAKAAIKGTRWLLLYRRDHLPKSKARQLQKALELNRPLATAYLLKEELALAWEQGVGGDGRLLLRLVREGHRQWHRPVGQHGPVADRSRRRVTELRCDQDDQWPHGGINRKIKTMLRQFYGLRDDDFLRLKLYALHESKHKLVG